MSRAHINSHLSLVDVLVPTDNNTIGLWHFDKTVESTNRFRPIEGIYRLDTGKFGKGVVIEDDPVNPGGLLYLIPTPVTTTFYFKLTTTEIRPDIGDDRFIIWYAKCYGPGGYYDDESSWQLYIPGGSQTLRLKGINVQQSNAIQVLDITNSEVNIYDGMWHFACVRLDGPNMEFTLDGVKKSLSTPWTTPPRFEMEVLGLGLDPQGFSIPGNVCIDELRCDAVYISDDELTGWRLADKPFYDPYDYRMIESSPEDTIIYPDPSTLDRTWNEFDLMTATEQESKTWYQLERKWG